MQAVPGRLPWEGESPDRTLGWVTKRALAVWVVWGLWYAYGFHSRGIVMDARAWSTAFGASFVALFVWASGSVLILRDPPKSLVWRVLSLAVVIVMVSGSFGLWVQTLIWLGATP